MPKKRAATYATKPSSPAHSSLSPSEKPKDASHSLASRATPTGNSVNDRIQQLRISQGSHNARASSEILNAGTSPTLPPSLRNILQLPDAPPPWPRPGLRVTGRMRGPAGPVAPPSWLKRRDNGTSSQAKLRTPRYDGERTKLGRLPGSFLPEEGSLIATTLKALARNWGWHVEYDQCYLATISVRYKEALLHYNACYGANEIDKAGLEVLFLDETELEDATGAEGLTHLDLATFIGNSLKLNELRDLFAIKKAMVSADEESHVIPESWDAPEFMAQPSGLPRFHSLTHLSLSHPNRAATWKGLLDLAPHLTTLTHLALAYWPTPTLLPNSTTAYRETPQGNVNYGGSNFYTAYDNDWSEAASVLRRLGKSTICLKWLDLTGCYPWVQALGYKQIDWFGGWQALKTVKVGQGWIPDCLKEEDDGTTWKSAYYPSLPGISEIKQRNQLIDWAQAAKRMLLVEDSVRRRFLTATLRYHHTDEDTRETGKFRNQDGDWDGDWDGTSSKPSKLAHGSTKVVFDHGWTGWWIRDAIEAVPMV